MKKFNLLKKLCLLLVFLLPLTANAFEGRGGGVPSTVLLSVGFGENFNDEKFINVNGLGAFGIVDIFNTDIWITSGLYTSLSFMGDLTSKDEVGDAGTNSTDAPSKGWGFSPGIVLGLTVGAIPYIDIHLLGTFGPSFALLTRYKIRGASETIDPNLRVKTNDIDGQVGYDYGGIAAIAYTGSNPWLQGITLGIEGGYHEGTFNRLHLGAVIGFSF